MRHSDWHARMHAEIQAANARPFAWGDHDCCMFAARVLDAMTDDDYVGRLRRSHDYASKESAGAILATGGGLLPLVTAILGQPIPWGWAQQGDAVLVVDGGGQETLGICEGANALCASNRGVRPYSVARALCAWRVV